MKPTNSRCFKRPSETTAFQGHSAGGGTRHARRAGRRSSTNPILYTRRTTARTNENVDRVPEALRSDRQLSIQQIAYTLYVSRFAVHGIMNKDLQMRKKCWQKIKKNFKFCADKN